MRASADPNPGVYEYRLFASLAETHLHHESKIGRAAFLHVPADNSVEAIGFGGEVAAAFIVALVDDFLTNSEDKKAEL